MGLRLTPQTINELKRTMQSFLPHYLNYDMVRPQELKYTFSDYMEWYTWNIEFHKIDFDVGEFDFYDTAIRFVTDVPDIPRLDIDFPALKHWKMDALMNSNSMFIP